MERLVIRAANSSETDLKFWAIECRNVGDQVGDFWGANAANQNPLVVAESSGRERRTYVSGKAS